jgi:hypothetical protein
MGQGAAMRGRAPRVPAPRPADWDQLPLISVVADCPDCSEAWELPAGTAAEDAAALGCRRCGGVVVTGEIAQVGQ